MLGDKYNPCKDIKDIKKAVKTVVDRIYVSGIIDMPYELRKTLIDNNIKLWVVSKNDTDKR